VIVQLEMGPEFERTVADLGSMGAAVVAACSEGLDKGGKIAAGTVGRDYLSGQYLKRRSGDLARHVSSWMAGEMDVEIGVPPGSRVAKYAWLLGDESKTIRPTTAKFLTIPIGENVTGAGVPHYRSPREVTEGFFVKSKAGNLLFGYKRGKRGKFRLLFVLVKSVFVQGSGALLDGVLDSLDDMTTAIEDEIAKIEGID